MSANLSRTLSAAVVSVLLAGCAAGPDFKRPDGPQADRYTESAQVESADGESFAQHLLLGEAPGPQWWHLFKSDTLDSIVDRALAGNRTLAAANWSLAQAQELANARAGALSPQIGATGGVGRQKYGAQFLGTLPKPPPFTYFSVGATVSYTLDYTGGVARSVEHQRALAEYRQHQVEAASLAVAGNAVTQALRIGSLQTQISTVETLLDRDRENLKLVQLAFDAGSVSRLDVVSARSQLASDTTLLPATSGIERCTSWPCAHRRQRTRKQCVARIRSAADHLADGPACQRAVRTGASSSRYSLSRSPASCGDRRRWHRRVEPVSTH